tara:strand:+ start:230 stop:967 length:738 start_codon:yes stop_codon:yes gene_type:complete
MAAAKKSTKNMVSIYRSVDLVKSKNKLISTDMEMRTEYTAYYIRVELANGEPGYTVTKRYSDFRRFYKEFIHTHGRLPDYKLPRKHLFTSMTEAVIERRKVKLQRLMSLVLQVRPISRHVVQFLTRVYTVSIPETTTTSTAGTYYKCYVTLNTGTTYVPCQQNSSILFCSMLVYILGYTVTEYFGVIMFIYIIRQVRHLKTLRRVLRSLRSIHPGARRDHWVQLPTPPYAEREQRRGRRKAQDQA